MNYIFQFDYCEKVVLRFFECYVICYVYYSMNFLLGMLVVYMDYFVSYIGYLMVYISYLFLSIDYIEYFFIFIKVVKFKFGYV